MMKKLIIPVLIVSCFSIWLAGAGDVPGTKETMRKIYRLYSEQEYIKAFLLVEESLKKIGPSQELLQLKYNILVKLRKYDEALAFIEEQLKRSGVSEELLAAKYEILFLQGNLVEALKAALAKEKIAKNKSPWDCINLVNVYLRMGSKDEALDWLQEAVKRGFISYRLLDEKKYTPLQSDKRFFQLVESMKMSAGLGYPAKNFTVKLLSGEDFTLAYQRGKVVLVYFWASWCDPCVKELPALYKIYRELKGSGFEFIAISLDSSAGKVQGYIDRSIPDLKHACSEKVWQDETVARYGVNSLPSLWLVDKKGFLRAFDIKGNELRSVIAFLLKEE